MAAKDEFEMKPAGFCTCNGNFFLRTLEIWSTPVTNADVSFKDDADEDFKNDEAFKDDADVDLKKH